MRLIPLLLVGLVLAAGCGGTTVTSGSSADEVAGLVPASVPVLVAFETDPESEQWQQADKLLSAFPGKQSLLDGLRQELADEGLDLEADVVPALGDETYLAVLDFEDDGDNVVAITRPRDKVKLTEVLRKSDEPLVTREVEGWTVIAQTDAVLDRFAAAGASLDGADWFQDAQGRVEEDALVTVFANGAAINDSLRDSAPEGCELPEEYGKLDYAAAVLSAEDDGVRFRLAAAGEGVAELLEGESLLTHVPSGAFAYLGSPGFDPDQFSLVDQLRCGLDSQDAPDVERELGVSYDDIVDLFAGGFALYARSGAIIPEVTLLLSPADEARAVATLDELADKVAALGLKSERRQVGDVAARALTVGPVTILYGAGDGKIAVSTSSNGFDALKADGDGLEDDDDFRAARDAAGVGDGDEVFVYLDLQELVQLVQALAGVAAEDLPADVDGNLEPLGSFLAWGNLSDPNDVEVGAFLTIK